MKLKVGVIFGGMSTEHDISIQSGIWVIENLSKEQYEIFPVYIDTEGIWYSYVDQEHKIEIQNVFTYLKNIDVVFPILHGKYGEDGAIQGMLDLLKVPYVGCGILASAISMDKVYTKIVMEKAKIKQAKYVFIKKEHQHYIFIDEKWNETKSNLNNICKMIQEKLTFPMFIKPSNSGSSIGIHKAKSEEELKKYIEDASRFDDKIIIEENIIGKEVECAILGNEASCVGEIISNDEFYSYDAKYKNHSKIVIPATISKDLSEKIKKTAIKAFKAVSGRGLARIDFFVNEKDIYMNEINTLPGFTNISMYAKLWQAEGISFAELLDKLIQLSYRRQ